MAFLSLTSTSNYNPSASSSSSSPSPIDREKFPLMGHHSNSHHHSLLHFRSFGKKEPSMVPKGWMAIRVGQEGEEQHRFVVPVVYLNHPLFVGLLKEAEEEYGFEHKGAITIPCRVEYFRQVQGIIDSDVERAMQHNHHHHQQQHHGHHHFHLGGCFGGLKV